MSRDSNIKLSVVIPAFTEALRLPHTLDESIRYLKSQAYGSEIIVVDDGSTDETGRIVQDRIPSAAVPLRLLAHPDKANHGKGAAVRRGMLETRGDYRLFMDADNSTTLEQVERFWPCFDKGYQVAIGSRALADSVIGIRQARYKELAGKFGNWIVRTFAVPEIRDTQAGFKMFTGGAADLIFPRQTIDRWGYDIEVLAIARLHHLRIAEVPITWVNAEGSKVTLKTYLEVLGEIRHIRRNLKNGVYS